MITTGTYIELVAVPLTACTPEDTQEAQNRLPGIEAYHCTPSPKPERCIGILSR